jgi:RHS repeat-associated protein
MRLETDHNLFDGVNRTLTYDANGNLTSDGNGKVYGWDAANRLISMTSGGNVTSWTYDGMGRRVQELQNGTITKQWVWCCGVQPCEERDANNNVTKRFFGLGEQIGGVNYYFTHDKLSSIREMTDSTGAIRARYDYDAWGRTTKVQGDLDADFRFQAMFFDAASGLYFTHHRPYDPNQARWLSRDPSGENSGTNLYEFVGGDPINFVDPLGLFRWGQFGRGVASIAGGILGTVALSAAEVGSGGLATAGVVVAGTTVAGAYSYGIGNVIASFSGVSDKDAAQMEGSPSSPAQLAARGIGGEPAQNAVGVVESLAELNGAKTGLEITKAAVETADAEKSLIDSLNEANKEKKPPCNK